MFSGFFDMDKPFWRWIGKLPELIALSVFWYVCCIPVITIIPASCALFDAVSRCTRLDNSGSFRRFFRTFWKELKRGIPLTVFWLIIAAVAYLGDNIILYQAESSSTFQIFSIMYRILILMLLGYLCWVIPLQSRYYNSFTGLHVNAMRFFLGRLPSTALMLLTSALVVIVCTIHPYLYFLVLFAPAVIALLHSIPVEKAFMIAFPDDYVDGMPVFTPEQRAAAQAISKAKKAEAEATDQDY